MRINKITILLFLFLIWMGGYGMDRKNRGREYEVIVSAGNGTTVRAGVLTGKVRISLKPDRYYWGYYLNGLFCKQGELEGKPLNGRFSRYDMKDNILESGVFRKGLKTGLWKNLSEEGTLTETGEYRKGVLHGEKVIYKEGKPERLEIYRKGILKGKPKNLNSKKEVTPVQKKKKKDMISRIKKRVHNLFAVRPKNKTTQEGQKDNTPQWSKIKKHRRER